MSSSRASTRTRAKSTRALEAEAAASASASASAAAAAAAAEEPSTQTAAGTSPAQAKKRATPARNRSSGTAGTTPATPVGRRAPTPASRGSSRATSPLLAMTASESRRVSNRRRPSAATQSQPASARATPSRGSRGSRGGSGSATPLSRSARSASVASNGHGNRGSASKSSSKNCGGRGYDPGRVNYKESEYHYGSDFEEEEDDVELEDGDSDKSDDSSETEMESLDSDALLESDVDLEADTLEPLSRPQTPVPFWLRGEEERVPPILLPKTSEDLLVPNNLILDVFSVYEILRRFHQMLRLSPFRMEDLCASLASEDQSNLLSEVHMALLKLLIRVDESGGTTFGALDQKDSINSVFYFMDSVTWPECLRAFLQSEPMLYEEPLELIKNCEYPFPTAEEKEDESKENLFVERRIKMLRFLTAQILSTAPVREFMTEGKAHQNEEHCRICFRLGEMLVCDTCPGVYHLSCLDPPLQHIPEDEWRCYLCVANYVPGVGDCTASDSDKSLLRQDTLGFDRSGNKYWFVCRRLVIEQRDGGVSYFSTVKQLEELSEILDDEVYEKELWANMEEVRVEMERQMDISEAITFKKKAGSRKSYFELENAAILKLQEDREAKRVKAEEDAQNKVQSDLEQMSGGGDAKVGTEAEAAAAAESKKEDQSEESRQERMTKREETRGDEFQSLDKDVVKKEEEGEATASESTTTVTQTTMTTTTTTSTTETKTLASGVISLLDKSKLPAGAAEVAEEMRMTRRTIQELSSGTLFFKLGQEGSYKSYANHFSTMAGALGKAANTEERIKRTHISHKFSLTDLSLFKWHGLIHGDRSNMVTTLRQTVLQLEANVSAIFMHPNWSLLRKPWIGAVTSSNTPRDFARAITVLMCCMKQCGFVNIWHDQLGHTTMKKFTAQMKEDKKKSEKKDKKDKDDEDERLRPYMGFVKYTLGLKHQVAKQRGEEYRSHGQFGWLWLSVTRNFSPANSNAMGLRAGPHRLAVKYSDIRDGTSKIVLMEPKAFAYLITKQEELEKTKTNGEEESMDTDETVKEEEKEEKEPATDAEKEEDTLDDKSREKRRLEEALKNARLEKQVIPDELLAEVADVCAGLSNPTRVLYPKVAKKARCIDDFLSRRIQLKTLEERRIELRGGAPLPAVAEPAKPKTEEEDKEKKPAALSLPAAPSSVEKSNEDETVDIEGDSKSNEVEAKDQKVADFVSSSKQEIWDLVSDLKAGSKLKRAADLKCFAFSCSPEKCYSVTCSNFKCSNRMFDAHKLCSKIVVDATELGLDVKETNKEQLLKSKTSSIAELQRLVHVLMKAKEEFDRLAPSVTTTVKTTVATTMTKTTSVNGELQQVSETVAKTESLAQSNAKENVAPDGTTKELAATHNEKSKTEILHAELTKGKNNEVKIKSEHVTTESEASTRVYSGADTTGKLYLKRIQSVAESKKQSKVVRYPLAPHFYSRTRKKRNILLLAKHDVKRMARKCGNWTAEGFNYNAKANGAVWPYTCPRPVFRSTWLYRTANMESLQAVALQLRILWACLRWDDMATRPISTDGKHQTQTDVAISTSELIRHRNVGRFMERTQYFQRKVTIPLDMPKNVVEVQPIRSGLRKRKRAESPVQAEPKVLEQWIDEEKLELWEVRAYREKLDRDKNVSITRSRTGTSVKEPNRYEPPPLAIRQFTPDKKLDPLDAKARMDETLRLQREALHNKQIHASTPQRILTVPSSSSTPIGAISRPNPAATVIRKVMNPDGTVSLVRTVAANNVIGGSPNATLVNPSTTKKLFIGKDGKIIGAQVMPGLGSPTVVQTSAGPQKVYIAPSLSQGPTRLTPQTSTPAMTTASPAAIAAAGAGAQQVQFLRSSDGKIQVRGLLKGQQLVQMPNGKLQVITAPGQLPGTPGASPKIALAPAASPQQMSPMVTKPITPATPKSIIAQPLEPGAQVPPGMTAFISQGKTYCIPKGVSTMAAAQAGGKLTPATAATPIVSPSVAPAQPKQQVVEVKSLGANTIKWQGNQMTVSGPDVNQAKQIAQLLSTGQAKLAMFAGKQVLISTTTAQAATSNTLTTTTTAGTTASLPTTPILPTQPLPPSNVALPQTPLPQTPEKVGQPALNSPPLQVTAHFTQTPQGPRIRLNGIQVSNLPRKDLAIISQQVKNQLLKAQAEAKEQGKVPPTKIVIDLPPEIQAKLQNPQEHTSQPPPGVLSAAAGPPPGVVPAASPIPTAATFAAASVASPSLLNAPSPVASLLGSSPVVSPLPFMTPTPTVAPLMAPIPSVISPVPSVLSPLTDAKPMSGLEAALRRPLPASPEKAVPSPVVVPAALAALSPVPQVEAPASPQKMVSPIHIASPVATVEETVVEEQAPMMEEEEVSSSPTVDVMTPEPTAEVETVEVEEKEVVQAALKRRSTQERSSPRTRVSRQDDGDSVEPPAVPIVAANGLGGTSLLGKRKRDSSTSESLQPKSGPGAAAKATPPPPSKKKKRGSSESTANAAANSSAVKSGLVKKDKIYCVCKTNYDPSKFYVGCDVCNNWFHGKCVGITETMSKDMSEYICDDCSKAKDSSDSEIYCVCKQPYDEAQFYIGCEGCAGWFHGRCVGILQIEAEKIDEYLCPNCDPNSKLNAPNGKQLGDVEREHIKRIVKQLTSHRNSYPFKQPVDPNTVPRYYEVIKEPMDLETIESRAASPHYTRLVQFVGDMMRIFENCRYFNQPESQIMKCASSLEAFFAQKLVLLREKVADPE